jgi:hypothetical protein
MLVLARSCAVQTNQNAAADERDPRRHVRNVEDRFQELIDHLREDVQKIDEPHAKALFETSAEVLGGLKKAFHDYDSGNEPAWR